MRSGCSQDEFQLLLSKDAENRRVTERIQNPIRRVLPGALKELRRHLWSNPYGPAMFEPLYYAALSTIGTGPPSADFQSVQHRSHLNKLAQSPLTDPLFPRCLPRSQTPSIDPRSDQTSSAETLAAHSRALRQR